MQRFIDISVAAFLVLSTLLFFTVEKIFVNEMAICLTLLFSGVVGICWVIFNAKNAKAQRREEELKLCVSAPFASFALHKKYPITTVDFALALFILWIILNALFVKQGAVDPFLWYKWAAVVAFYIIVRLTRQREFLLYALVLSGVIQTLIAAGQRRGVLFSNHTMFDVTGSFGNPGQLGGYLAVCLTVTLCLLMFIGNEHRGTENAKGNKHEDTKDTKIFYEDRGAEAQRFNLLKKLCVLRVFAFTKNPRAFLLFCASIAQCFGLYLSDSRAGWVGVFVGVVCGLFLIFKHEDTKSTKIFYEHRGTETQRFNLLKKLCASVSLCLKKLCALRAFVFTLFILFFAVGIVFLYSYRPKSADARLLIWRVSCDMIAERPLLGHGAGAFYDKYMLYQAAFFEKNPQSRFVTVADNVGNPFNELLNTAVSLGFVGVALLLFLLWAAFFSTQMTRITQISADDSFNTTKIFKAGLSAWLAFAMFSYPAGVFPLVVVAVACLALINTETQRRRGIILIKNSVLSCLCVHFVLPILLIITILFHLLQTTTQLKQLSTAFRTMNAQTSIDIIENSYHKMKSNPTFNSYYSSWLEHQPVEQYTDRVKDVSPSCEGFTMLGRYYLATGETEQAEQAFYTASNMVPTRIRPKYALWKLYVEKGDTVAARKMAQKILDSPVKIESIYTLKVKKEVKMMLENENK